MDELGEVIPMVILGSLVLISWLTKSRGLWLITVGVFLATPTLIGYATFGLNKEYIEDVLSYWINEVLRGFFDYLNTV